MDHQLNIHTHVHVHVHVHKYAFLYLLFHARNTHPNHPHTQRTPRP